MLNKSIFEIELQKNIHNPSDFRYLLAVSGGVDSMVMVNLFNDLGLDFEIAHINYKLRGESSNLDQKLVEDFAEKQNVCIHVYEVSEKDSQPQHSIQLWARELRYSFFEKIKKEKNIDYLVTAHHLNDQLETFIINLSKASGINGLSGIPRNENKIIRPLLQFSKKEIYDFAKANFIDFREDESNAKNDYLRNKIRNKITPLLLETNEHFLENFSKSMEILHQTRNFVHLQIEKIFNEILISECKNEVVLSKKNLQQESHFVQFEILKKYGFSNNTEIYKLFEAETGSSFFTKTQQVNIDRNFIHFVVKKEEKKPSYEKIMIAKTKEILHQKLHLDQSITNIDEINKSFSWYFDADKIEFPIYLRKKKLGDTIFPLGFSGSKTVAKFFKDEKLPILAKQKIWLLTDNKDNVLGIIPLRQDRRFVANNNTTNILTIYNEENNEV